VESTADGVDATSSTNPRRAFRFCDPGRQPLDQFGLHTTRSTSFAHVGVAVTPSVLQRLSAIRADTPTYPRGWLQRHDAAGKGHIGHQTQVLLSIFIPKECRASHSAHRRSWEPGYGLAHGVARFLDWTAAAHRARAVASISWTIDHFDRSPRRGVAARCSSRGARPGGRSQTIGMFSSREVSFTAVTAERQQRPT